MGTIPADAIHWDSGDWIDWYRSPAPNHTPPCAAPSADPMAQMHTLRTRMLRCARAYYEMTGQHLPIYDEIARVHAAVAFEIPLDLDGPARPCVLVLPPHGATDIIRVDLSKPFCTLIVVRIRNNFKVEDRILPRAALPKRATDTVDLRWRDLKSIG